MQQNNNWNNVLNTQQGTNEIQKNDMLIQVQGVDNIVQYQENDFDYDDKTTLEYDEAENFLWDYSYN